MFRIFQLSFLIIILLTISGVCQASWASPPGDNNYYIQKYPTHRIIFDRQYLPYIDELNKKIEYYIRQLNQIHLQTIDPRFTIIIASSQIQISNALAAVYPFLHVKIFPSGVEILNPFASHLWFDFTFIHELNHLFQVNYTIFPNFMKIKRPFLGMLFPYLNFLLPSLFTEGDSVFKESLWGIGGRMYSGEVRALVYSQIKYYKNRPRKLAQKLINNHIHPHNNKVQYFHGGYLFTALSNVFSHEKINEFFKNNGQSLISLMTFNYSLKRTFKMNIIDLVRFYIETFKNEATKQKSDINTPLFKTALCPEINRYQNQILLLTTDLQSTPKLRSYDTRLKTWKSQIIDLPLGKVFYFQNRYYSRSSHSINPYEIIYSLFSSGLQAHPKIRSQFVQDISKQDVLAIDTKNNIKDYQLLLNNQFYDTTHSNAVFDSQKNIYYFKQNNNKRTLYKNKQPIFSYSGYYGKLVDVRPDGSIFFIAPSAYGSSVYKYFNNQITRSLSSDTVVQAKTINNKEIIICEVTPGGYVYKKTAIEEIQSNPVIYQYPFETTPYYQESQTKPIKSLTPSQPYALSSPPSSSKNSIHDEYNKLNPAVLDEVLDDLNQHHLLNSTEETKSSLTSLKFNTKKYSAFKNIRLSEWAPFSFSTNSLSKAQGIYWNSQLLFTDDLMKNSLNLSVSGYSLAYYQFSISYSNRIHPIRWSIGYEFSFLNQLSRKYDTLVKKYPLDRHQVNLSGGYVLFQKGRWQSFILSTKSLSLNKIYTTYYLSSDLFPEKIHIKGSFQYFKIDWKPTWSLIYNQSYSLNTFPNKGFNLQFIPHYMHYFSSDKKIQPSFNTAFNFNSILHLSHEFYIKPHLKYLKSWTGFTDLVYERPLPLFTYLEQTSNIKYPEEISGKSILSLGSEIVKSIHTPIYSSKIPLSLRRIIPSIKLEYRIIERPKSRTEHLTDYLDKLNHLEELTFQLTVGVDLLIYFKNPVILYFNIGRPYYLNTHSSAQPYAQMNLQFNF